MRGVELPRMTGKPLSGARMLDELLSRFESGALSSRPRFLQRGGQLR